MTIKGNISLLVSLLFSFIYGAACILVFTLFSNFRKEEFKARLAEKALNSVTLLTKVREVDKELLQIIDQNSINRLYDEKTLIFDADYRLIYSSLDDTQINWKVDDLKFLYKNKQYFRKDGEKEIYGFFYDSDNKDYFALVSANDKYGKRKLVFLGYILLISYCLFTVTAWTATYSIVRRALNPLNEFQKKIKSINDLKALDPLDFNRQSKHEIDLLSQEFNLMMQRIGELHQQQKEFTSQASHELRTPLARMSARLENHLQYAPDNLFLKTLLDDIVQLNEIVHSLLILAKMEGIETQNREYVRIDEVIYNSIEKICNQYPVFKISFDIENEAAHEEKLQVMANQILLEIAFNNLLRNAFLYSSDQKAMVRVYLKKERLMVSISNTGETLSVSEQKKLFDPFMRGANARGVAGLGIGLRIVNRILYVFGFQIRYESGESQNSFFILF